MFVDAIEKVGEFTRPIFSIMRPYGSAKVLPNSATLFFVNEEGWAVTTKGIAKMVIDARAIEQKYDEFRQKKRMILESGQREILESGQGENLEQEEGVRALEEEYKYTQTSIAQIKVRFIDCVDSLSEVQCRMHPNADLAILKLEGFNELKYHSHAVFAAEGHETRQGKYLCRLGFPFPEFENFMYDAEHDEIAWTNEGVKTSPRFPSEGMVTRLISTDNRIAGIEMSTPGFVGQNGGPLFDENGVVQGMQSDIGSLSLGRCIHGEIIKQFLKEEGIQYYTEENVPSVRTNKIDLSYIMASNSGKLQ